MCPLLLVSSGLTHRDKKGLLLQGHIALTHERTGIEEDVELPLVGRQNEVLRFLQDGGQNGASSLFSEPQSRHFGPLSAQGGPMGDIPPLGLHALNHLISNIDSRLLGLQVHTNKKSRKIAYDTDTRVDCDVQV